MKRSATYWRMKWRRRAARFKASGRTTRGGPRRIRQCRELDPLHGPARKLEYDRRRYHAVVVQQGGNALRVLVRNFAAGRRTLEGLR